MKDCEGRYILINTRYKHLFHLTNDQIQGKTDRDIFPKEIADALTTNDNDIIRQQQPLEFEERVLYDGKEYMYLSIKFPIYHSDGTILGVCGISTDITERKNVEEELHRHRAHLEELVSERTAALQAANEELKSFAYITSHDLKAPLRAISRLAQWLTEDYANVLDEQGKEMVELLIQRVKRMDNLIHGILEYSRIGRILEQHERIDLNSLVTEVIDTLAPLKHVTVTLENEFPVIRGDRIRLLQVFQNLIGNAVKFLDNSPGEVRIGCISEESYWKFWVADNGPGIEKRHYERIFQIFQTLKSRDEQENTGVGLAIVKKIVEFHHGKIWVESHAGEGTTFFFLLPKDENTA